jgi:hypothetical protein
MLFLQWPALNFAAFLCMAAGRILASSSRGACRGRILDDTLKVEHLKLDFQGV